MSSPDTTPMYGLYLIPPASLVAPLSVAHATLQREFGARVAGRFMVHVTVKGFFKPKAGADIDRLVTELDRVYAGRDAFQVSFLGPRLLHGERGSSVLIELELTDPLWQLQQDTWKAIEPWVADDCPFTPNDRPATYFYPHLTLVQYDLPSGPILQEQALDLCREICEQLPSQAWEARDLQFIGFESQAWLGAWWDTLRFRQIEGWRLGRPTSPSP
jgi:2'-5' RNA ligase